jgi:Zn ribbon nucleic-acid-binding protein
MKYRCPECGSSDLSSDGEVWARVNPSTGEVLSDILSEPALLCGQDGPDEPDPEVCRTECLECGFESDRLADFRTKEG